MNSQVPTIEMVLTQDILRVKLSYSGAEFEKEIRGKVIEVNGKFYFQPLGTNKLYDVSKAKYIGDIKPETRYIKFETGVYAPADLDYTVIDLLKELDEDYKKVREEFNKVCKGDPTKCKTFRDFKKYYLRQFVAIGKQAMIVVDELKQRGFTFRVKKNEKGNVYVVYVKGADGEVDGKWTPLRDTVKLYVIYGGGIYDEDVFETEIDEELESWYNNLPESPIYIDLVKISDDGTHFESYVRLDKWYDVKIFPLSPIPKDKITYDHHYYIEYIIVGELNGEKIGVALDYTVSHPTTTERYLYHVIKEREGKKYEMLVGTKREVCKKCGLVVEERPIVKTLGRTYIYEINGELYYKRYDESSESDELAKIDKWTTLVGNIKPDARYKELNGVYLPLDYLTEEVEKLEKLDKVLKKQGYKEEERARRIVKKLVTMLEKKGFEIEIEEDYVHIKAPDGKEGSYHEHEDWDYEYVEGSYHTMTWTNTMIDGELALTSMSIYNYY